MFSLSSRLSLFPSLPLCRSQYLSLAPPPPPPTPPPPNPLPPSPPFSQSLSRRRGASRPRPRKTLKLATGNLETCHRKSYFSASVEKSRLTLWSLLPLTQLSTLSREIGPSSFQRGGREVESRKHFEVCCTYYTVAFLGLLELMHVGILCR